MKRDEFARNLMAGMSGLMVLDLLREGPGYGYGLRQRICQQSHHALQWQDGTLYPVLRRLEDQGLVTSVWANPPAGRRRRYYRLTPRGQRTWSAQRQQWLRFSGAVNAVLASRS
jgi:DNA-binding PadR family transcriptional regulator